MASHTQRSRTGGLGSSVSRSGGGGAGGKATTMNFVGSGHMTVSQSMPGLAPMVQQPVTINLSITPKGGKAGGGQRGGVAATMSITQSQHPQQHGSSTQHLQKQGHHQQQQQTLQLSKHGAQTLQSSKHGAQTLQLSRHGTTPTHGATQHGTTQQGIGGHQPSGTMGAKQYQLGQSQLRKSQHGYQPPHDMSKHQMAQQHQQLNFDQVLKSPNMKNNNAAKMLKLDPNMQMQQQAMHIAAQHQNPQAFLMTNMQQQNPKQQQQHLGGAAPGQYKAGGKNQREGVSIPDVKDMNNWHQSKMLASPKGKLLASPKGKGVSNGNEMVQQKSVSYLTSAVGTTAGLGGSSTKKGLTLQQQSQLGGGGMAQYKSALMQLPGSMQQHIMTQQHAMITQHKATTPHKGSMTQQGGYGQQGGGWGTQAGGFTQQQGKTAQAGRGQGWGTQQGELMTQQGAGRTQQGGWGTQQQGGGGMTRQQRSQDWDTMKTATSSRHTGPLEDYDQGPDYWGEKYHGMHFPMERRFSGSNVNSVIFNDKQDVNYRSIVRYNNPPHGDPLRIPTPLLKMGETQITRYAKAHLGQRLTTAQKICRKIADVLDQHGGTEVLLARKFRKEMRDSDKEHRTRTFQTFEEVEKTLADLGGCVTKQELEYVFGEESPDGITFSQMVFKVNDLLYTGYTNGRPDFFTGRTDGRRMGKGPSARYDDFKPWLLEHNMTNLPPEAFKAPLWSTRKEAVDRHHRHSVDSINDWNSHWVKKEISKPKPFYVLGDGKGTSSFSEDMTSGVDARELIFGKVAPHSHVSERRDAHERHRGKRTFPDQEEPRHIDHHKNFNKITSYHHR